MHLHWKEGLSNPAPPHCLFLTVCVHVFMYCNVWIMFYEKPCTLKLCTGPQGHFLKPLIVLRG